MSKSATEQYQIKKKRKHNANRNIINNTINKNSNRKFIKNNKRFTPFTTAATAKQSTNNNSSKSNNLIFHYRRNYFGLSPKSATTTTVAAAESFALSDGDYDNLAEESKASTFELVDEEDDDDDDDVCCLRDKPQVQRQKLLAAAAAYKRNMPLSQGYNAKGGATTKRGITTLTKVNGGSSGSNSRYEAAAKRSKSIASEHFISNSISNANSNNSYNYSNNVPIVRKNTATTTTSSSNKSTVNAMHLQQQQQLLLNGCSNTEASNNLQLSYLLGESLARYGRLQEAFDIYAIIVSEQHDAYIPLERLNTLAASIIAYFRQLSNKQQHDDDSAATFVAEDVEVEVDEGVDINLGKRFAMEKTLKSKFAKHQSGTATWNTAAGSAAAASSAASVMGAGAGTGNLGMHATARELRIPSPALCDDYDPLLCPLCRDILRCPVTTNCGHTFCRQCCETITMCNICHIKFPRTTLDDFVADVNFTTKNYVHESAYTNLLASASAAATTSTTTSSSAAGTSSTAVLSSSLPAPSLSLSSASSTTLAPATAFFHGISNDIAAAAAAAATNDNLLFQRRFNASSRRNLSATYSNSTNRAATSSLQRPPVFLNRLRLVASPTTVTTTTVASTTATATTTMASTSATTAAATATAGGIVGVVGINNVGGSGVGGGGGRGSNAADSMKFMPDVLVRRLVEKWWGSDLQAKKINETAASYMHLNLLDEALKFCNASLEKSPTNFKSLLLRAEVLRKLNHFQSSLADVDNALKARYTSPKAHYLRALALSELGRFDEALFDNCLAISLDNNTNLTSSELFQHDLAKNLQKLLAQSPKNKLAAAPHHHSHHRTFATRTPYSILAEHRLRRKQIALLVNDSERNRFGHELFDDDFITCEKQCNIISCDDDEVVDVDILDIGCAVGVNREISYASIGKDYELELRRQTSRKHFRRKWAPRETELMPTMTLNDSRCSVAFRSILERTQQELLRLKKLESSGESPHNKLIQVPANIIDASDFDCVLCCRTFWKPVVTPCGHTYCWVCLDRCMDYTSSCPLCMSPLVEPNVNMYQGATSPVPFILAKRPVTKFLEAAMKRFIPDGYQKRFRQEMDMEPSVPVFICTTAFPYVPCPLFVYEPRYRLMVRRAVESGEKQFGIVQPHSGKSRYFDVGTILDIRDCVLLGDGCSILSTIGCKRFKILARNEKDGYETAKVEYIYDETISDENIKLVSTMHASVLSKAIDWFESLSSDLKQEILQSFGEIPPVEDNWESIADGPAWAWWIIALLPLSQQLKVDILATTSLEKRLRAIEKTLDYMSGTFRRTQQNCSVVVVQQQHHQHQQQQQQQQQQQCDNDLTQTCETDVECCQHHRSTTHGHALTATGEHHHHHHHTTTSEHSELML